MDALTPFEGGWTLLREIEDRRAERLLRFEGAAVFRRDGEGLVYEESGRWTEADWGGMAATQRYLWRARGERIAVLYADGRPFHDFAVGEDGRAAAGHDCAPDRYDVAYAFTLPEGWEAVWTVRGPAKDYLSRTVYRRA